MLFSPDFSTINDAADSATVIAAIVAACGVIGLVGFASWASKLIARFFDDDADLEEHDEYHRNRE